MGYDTLLKLFFALEPERAHRLALGFLNAGRALALPRILAPSPVRLDRHLMGLTFPNPVGLAAGLDKNGEYIAALAGLGFGFIEVGTVTPRPQPGNPPPRLFRLPRAQALINRMGFNNKGVDHLVSRVKASRYPGVLGINIGKNFDTPLERGVDDYLVGLRTVYGVASYVVVNVSSPNTPGLRTLQHGGLFDELLQVLKSEQRRLAVQFDRYVPLVVKISPDIDDAGVRAIAEGLKRHGIDGVAATNTSLSREGVAGMRHAEEAGGLSGAPLLARSNQVLRVLANALEGTMPIIGVGGITTGAGAVMKARAGADLVQLYTGLIYRGPALIGECARALSSMDSSIPAVAGGY